MIGWRTAPIAERSNFRQFGAASWFLNSMRAVAVAAQDEDRAMSKSNHAFRDRSDQQVLEPGAAMRRHYDQIGVEFFRQRDNLVAGVANADLPVQASESRSPTSAG